MLVELSQHKLRNNLFKYYDIYCVISNVTKFVTQIMFNLIKVVQDYGNY